MMKRKMYVFTLALSSITSLLVGSVYAQGPATNQPFAIMSHDITETPAFQVFSMQQYSVEAEVQYLINLTRFSDNSFWRNGRVYTSEQAAEWLSYKAIKFEDEFSSTEEFIETVASFSRKSGKPYYIVYSNRARIPAKRVLYAELSRLRSHLS